MSSYKLTDTLYINSSNIESSKDSKKHFANFRKIPKSKNFHTFIKAITPYIKLLKESADRGLVVVICCDNSVLKSLVIVIAYHMIYHNMSCDNAKHYLGIDKICTPKYEDYLKSLELLLGDQKTSRLSFSHSSTAIAVEL